MSSAPGWNYNKTKQTNKKNNRKIYHRKYLHEIHHDVQALWEREIIHTKAKTYIWYPTASMSEFSFYKPIRWFVLSPDSYIKYCFLFSTCVSEAWRQLGLRLRTRRGSLLFSFKCRLQSNVVFTLFCLLRFFPPETSDEHMNPTHAPTPVNSYCWCSLHTFPAEGVTS